MSTETSASDRTELKALIDAYALAVDDRDGERFIPLFLRGATLSTFPPGATEPRFALGGPEEIWAWISHRANEWTHSFHCNMNHVCEVHGDQATGVVYCRANHLVEDVDGATNLTVAVRYVDRYARSDGRWRFASRDLHTLWCEEAPTRATSPFPVSPAPQSGSQR